MHWVRNKIFQIKGTWLIDWRTGCNYLLWLNNKCQYKRLTTNCRSLHTLNSIENNNKSVPMSNNPLSVNSSIVSVCVRPLTDSSFPLSHSLYRVLIQLSTVFPIFLWQIPISHQVAVVCIPGEFILFIELNWFVSVQLTEEYPYLLMA